MQDFISWIISEAEYIHVTWVSRPVSSKHYLRFFEKIKKSFFAKISSITILEHFLKILKWFDNQKCIIMGSKYTMVTSYLLILIYPNSYNYLTAHRSQDFLKILKWFDNLQCIILLHFIPKFLISLFTLIGMKAFSCKPWYIMTVSG